MRAQRRAEQARVSLPYQAPYDWDAIIAFLRARAIDGMEVVSPDQYARTFAIDGSHGVVIVTPARANTLEATLYAPQLPALPQVLERVQRLFDLSANPREIGARLAQDALLAPLVAARPGLRVPGAWDSFELTVRAVLGQQITVKAAAILAAKLVQRYGTSLEAIDSGLTGLTHVFPTPVQLEKADIRTLGMPQSRARTLTSLAAAAASDSGLFAVGLGLGEAVTRLRALYGVGEWTAQYVAMRALREPDAFPADDVGLRRALAADDGRRPSSGELLARAEGWRPWRAYAAQHLWTSLAGR